jgi:hypothetical protein
MVRAKTDYTVRAKTVSISTTEKKSFVYYILDEK